MNIPNTLSRDFSNDELMLFLIKRELKIARFFDELSKLGFDHTTFSISLGKAILSLAGFDTHEDELWNWYYETLYSYIEKVDLKGDLELDELALKFGMELRSKRG